MGATRGPIGWRGEWFRGDGVHGFKKGPLQAGFHDSTALRSRVPLSAADGDVYDWAIPWDQWTKMSALH